MLLRYLAGHISHIVETGLHKARSGPAYKTNIALTFPAKSQPEEEMHFGVGMDVSLFPAGMFQEKSLYLSLSPVQTGVSTKTGSSKIPSLESGWQPQKWEPDSNRHCSDR